MDTAFERSTVGKDEWLTPPEIIKALGTFDLDPCASSTRPWPRASGIMFLKGRLVFHHADGTKPNNSAGAPSCLVSYGGDNARILQQSSLKGKFLHMCKEKHYGNKNKDNT